MSFDNLVRLDVRRQPHANAVGRMRAEAFGDFAQLIG
jgi:hypothetical protein